jgi:putative RecB family exonuclease
MTLYSHSRLSCFEQCPLKFKLHYIDKVETEVEDTVEAFLGSRVHEALEKLYKDLKFAKLNTLPELLSFYNQQWLENWNDAIVIVRKEYDKENYRKMGEKFITDYYNRYKPFDQTTTVGLETEKSVELNNKHHIHIRIDRLCFDKDGVYEIHDYKTSNSLPTQQDLDEDRQLALYAYGVRKMYPDASEVKLIWHYLAFDKEMVSTRKPETLEALRKEVLSLIESIEKEEKFPSHVSTLCDWCEFQAICPEWKHKFETQELKPNEYLKEDGVTLVNSYASVKDEADKLNEKLEKIREALIAYAKDKGLNTVFGSDVKASISSYPKLSFPKKGDPNQERFFEMIKKIGLWDQLSTVDVYELAKMINNKEMSDELVRLLEIFITKNDVTTVRIRKK